MDADEEDVQKKVQQEDKDNIQLTERIYISKESAQHKHKTWKPRELKIVAVAEQQHKWMNEQLQHTVWDPGGFNNQSHMTKRPCNFSSLGV